MKKLTVLLVMVVLCCFTACAVAEGIDFSSMSDEALRDMVDKARNELTRRELTAGENTVLLEQEGVTVYMTGSYGIDELNEWFYVEIVVVNDSSKDIQVQLSSSSVNGWEIYGIGVDTTPSGKKQKGDIILWTEDASVTTVEEIEDIELAFCLYDTVNYDIVAETEPVVINFPIQ